eukprot:6212804-Pleurochrysis_carterae.AAC.1
MVRPSVKAAAKECAHMALDGFNIEFHKITREITQVLGDLHPPSTFHGYFIVARKITLLMLPTA